MDRHQTCLSWVGHFASVCLLALPIEATIFVRFLVHVDPSTTHWLGYMRPLPLGAGSCPRYHGKAAGAMGKANRNNAFRPNLEACCSLRQCVLLTHCSSVCLADVLL